MSKVTPIILICLLSFIVGCQQYQPGKDFEIIELGPYDDLPEHPVSQDLGEAESFLLHCEGKALDEDEIGHEEFDFV